MRKFLSRLAQCLQPLSYPAFEEIIQLGAPSCKLYVVVVGIVASEGKMLHKGDRVGADFICDFDKCLYSAVSLTFCSTLMLTLDDLYAVIAGGGRNFEPVGEAVTLRIEEVVPERVSVADRRRAPGAA